MATGIRRAPWRDAATVLLAVVLATAALSVVLDGGRPAFAADSCQYGPYGPYGQECEKVTPSLTPAPLGSPQLGSFQLVGVTLGGGESPTGMLTFRLYRPADSLCASAAFESNVVVNRNGTYFSSQGPFSGSPYVSVAGTWRWVVSYSGDATNEAVSLGCGSFTVSVVKAQPLLAVSTDSGPLPLGSSLAVSATLQGGFQPSGTLAMGLFGPGDASCSTPLDQRSFAVSSFGPYQASLTPTASGTWRVVASYSGDESNASTGTTCGSSAIEVVVPPANDGFADATNVSTLPFEDTANLAGASLEPGEPSGCWLPSRTAWYAFTPADDMRVTSSLSVPNALTVFAATQPGLSSLNLVSCGTGTIGLEKGVTYYFRVDGPSAGLVTFGLEAEPQPNDEPSGARMITYPRYSDSDDSRYATSSPSDPSCFGGGDTVWYAFTPDEDMRLEAAVQPWYGDQASRFTLSAYTQSGGGFQSLDCSDDSLVVSGYRKPHIEFDALAGQTVYFMIGTSGGTAGGGYYFGLQRPLDVTVTVDTKAGTVTKDGVATLRGTVACSRETWSTARVTLDQVFAGRQRANGSADVGQSCVPTGQTWSATLTSFPILFGAGRATVTVQVPSTCDPQGCQPGALYDETSYDRTTINETALKRK